MPSAHWVLAPLRSIARVPARSPSEFQSAPSRFNNAWSVLVTARRASSCCSSAHPSPSRPLKSPSSSTFFTPTNITTSNLSPSPPPSQFFTTLRMSPDGSPPSADEVSKYLRQSHDRLFDNNRAWAAEKAEKDPGYFARLSEGQSPEYLWIGCSDSRIPAEQITGLEPGEAFIHRNIANLVCNTDLNVMSVINYAVRHLGVKHIIVCGHYGCGGVKAAMTPKDMGLLNPWLRNIRDVYRLHEKELDTIADEEQRYNRLVELNVEEQCRNIIKTAAVQQSFAKNQYPIVHGWVFGFRNGLLKDLKIDFQAVLKDVQKIYNLADAP
ncbi:carbonic anhydrase 2 [Metarhizium rileyi]|uniref:Carbonic anhydrase n=2 Tax=Metarhizium rileyi (strain RCEF 4871) TaxID=1649241 RepID=A0A162JQL4_METRR|nr:carbonic anhydrase 2 [Metarhizium rileyi RCEF 4871]